MRTSSCCSDVDPTHLKKAEDVKQRIEGTKLYNIMAEYKKHNKMDVQKCCHKKAQANCIHFAIMLLLSLSVDTKDGTTKQQVNIDIVNLLIKEKKTFIIYIYFIYQLYESIRDSVITL